MEALRQSVGATEPAVKGKKMRKASAGQKEMLMPIEGKKPAKQAVKKTTKS
jgi:DNA end-binding protein Ku